MKSKTTRIIILGRAGNGIRFFARKFIRLLSIHDKKIYITYYFDYDSTVRGGNTIAYIVISEILRSPIGAKKDKNKKPNGFIFNSCDLLISFRENSLEKYNAKEMVGKVGKKGIHIDFEKLSLINFKKQIHANMIAFGYLAAKFDIKDKLPSLKQVNKKAFNLGYKLFT